MAAAAAALAMGLGRDAVREGLRGFAGLPHRLERVAEAGGVLYVNDSKATNVAAAAAGLRSFDGGVRAILGGSLKGQDFTGLVEPVGERCVACYLIGDAAEPLERDLEPARDAGVELRRCEGLADAVRAAAADARAGEVVLLSPACASFDAYRRLRAAGRALPLPGRGARRLGSPEGSRLPGANTTREMTALSLSRLGPKTRRRAGAQPIEYNLLLTATLCLLAFGVVMVFSASSTTSLLGQSGDSAYYLKRTLLFGAAGLLVMRVLSLRGMRLLRPLTPLLVAGSFVLLLAVLIPGIGMSANGAQRWIGAGLFQVQPSEFAKLALVLYGAHLLASRPRMTREHPHPDALPGGGRPRLLADGGGARPGHGDRRPWGDRRAAGRRRGEDPPPGACWAPRSVSWCCSRSCSSPTGCNA